MFTQQTKTIKSKVIYCICQSITWYFHLYNTVTWPTSLWFTFCVGMSSLGGNWGRLSLRSLDELCRFDLFTQSERSFLTLRPCLRCLKKQQPTSTVSPWLFKITHATETDAKHVNTQSKVSSGLALSELRSANIGELKFRRLIVSEGGRRSVSRH